MGALQQLLSSHKAAAGGGSFTPLDLPSLKAWYDCSTLAGSFGDPIGTVPDLSGNGFDWVQTGGNRALLVPGAVNSLTALRFDGTSSYYIVPFGFPASSTWTVVAIYAKPSSGGAGANQRIVSAPGTSNDFVDGLIVSESTGATYSPKGVISELTSRVPSWLGTGLEVNTDGSPNSSAFGGDLCEVILCRSAFSGTDGTKVRAYALSKWGVTIP